MYKAAALLVACLLANPAAGDITPARQGELLHLLLQDCGSCHGIMLQGGLGPALTPKALAGKTAGALRRTILDGRAGTPMAPWRPFMNEEEAAWLAQVLIKGKTDE